MGEWNDVIVLSLYMYKKPQIKQSNKQKTHTHALTNAYPLFLSPIPVNINVHTKQTHYIIYFHYVTYRLKW